MHNLEMNNRKKPESFYQSLFKNNQEIMFLINPDTFEIEDCNQAACSFYGYAYEDMLNHGILSFNGSTEDQALKEMYLSKDQKVKRFFLKHRLSNGKLMDVAIHSTKVNLDGRELLFSIVSDTTDSRIADENLRTENMILEKMVFERTYHLEESYAKLKELNHLLLKAKTELEQEYRFMEAIFESIPGFLYVYDEEGKLIKWNKKHEEITGYTSEELSEKTLGQWYEGEDAVRVAQTIEEVFRTGYGEVEAQLIVKGGRKLLIRFNGVRLNMNEKTYFTGVGIDITDRKKLEEALVKESKLLETTLTSVGDGVVSCDKLGQILFINRVAEDLTGWTREEALGQPIEEVFHIINEFTREKSENIVKQVIETRQGNELANHALLISKDGCERSIEDSAAPIMEENGEIIGVVLVFRDFSEKKQKQDQITFLSYHDQLTGLYNRRFYEEELKRLDTRRNLPLSIVMGDVNGLKLINDSFGHAVGDELLKKTAEILKKGCRADDIIARLGGDEFVILLPQTDALETEEIIRRIKTLASREKVRGLDISISFGYETKYDENEAIEKIFKKTEDNMYRHKLSEGLIMRSKTIGMVMQSLFEKNSREMSHSKRVGIICEQIAIKLGLEADVLENLKIAGRMHDIGKIGINDGILNHSHRLDDQEWTEIKRHPEIGYRILSSVNEFSEIADYILEHHERWDGKGYPRGLKGKEISLEARIIAIADAYDAMTKKRPYTKGLSIEEAITEIRECSGKQFDPEIAKVFIEQLIDNPL